MKSKKSNILLGKRAVDKATKPFSEVSITDLCSAFTSHAFIMSPVSKFTAYLCRLDDLGQSRPLNFIKKFLDTYYTFGKLELNYEIDRVCG